MTAEATAITVEKDVTGPLAHVLFDLYGAAFGHLAELAAARQLLHEAEFLEEMADPRVHKYVGWGADGIPVGLCTMTTALDAVPWISPEFYAARYPEHHARGAVYYLGIAMVHPAVQGHRVFPDLVARVAEIVRADRGVLAWDLCGRNKSLHLDRLFASILHGLADVTVGPVDQQVYYGGVFHGPREVG